MMVGFQVLTYESTDIYPTISRAIILTCFALLIGLSLYKFIMSFKNPQSPHKNLIRTLLILITLECTSNIQLAMILLSITCYITFPSLFLIFLHDCPVILYGITIIRIIFPLLDLIEDLYFLSSQFQIKKKIFGGSPGGFVSVHSVPLCCPVALGAR